MAEKAAKTAVGPMLVTAIEQYEPPERRLITDDLALGMLPLAARWLVAAAKWPPLRRALVSAVERQASGLWLWMLCRKRYFDDALVESLAAGCRSVVILGAGFDTRGRRLACDTPVFEVDQARNIAAKRARATIPANVTLVPIDFEKDDLATVLDAHGYRAEFPTVFVWEGVTQYLTESAVRTTLSSLSHAAPGSRLGFTFVSADFIDGTADYGTPILRHSMVDKGIWLYGIAPEAVAPLLAEYGWNLLEQQSAADFRIKYLTESNRPGPILELEHCAFAQKL
ncbi:SAM-dependent methyltransferase [Nocardia panacis]|uniref:S-adenosyl-L-methionine-dependent methyltransferase n=1 Tax=Nocardia panacis TaxID=2340916 RepID=A0A3A4K1N8_9NOCA|nr:SAM-dependent methyltransferase [Nocardia panacis]RJO73660.1 SAM-dependent methyltransferase [Nocardia panacis]